MQYTIVFGVPIKYTHSILQRVHITFWVPLSVQWAKYGEVVGYNHCDTTIVFGVPVMYTYTIVQGVLINSWSASKYT